MQEVNNDDKKTYSYTFGGNMTGGLIVLGIGVFFLLVNLDVLPPLRTTWPLILIVVGAALIISKMRR
ncbi:MAG: DUF5668 domain-containing protein [Candidatus Zixiibacteriota bacterium]